MTKKYYTDFTPEPVFTTGDIAHYCQVTVMQVNRWIRNNKLSSFRNPGGQYRITESEFRNFLERNSMPIIEEFFEKIKEKKILIADDDSSVVDALCHLLKKNNANYHVEVAYDGYETLIKAGDFKPDLLILDIRMPRIDGLEICHRLRQDKTITPGIKILAITGHSEMYDRDVVLENGANEYLLKPFDSKSIIQYVEKLLS